LTAFTYLPSGYLRQGCNLVLDPDKAYEFSEVYSNGGRVPAKVTAEEALEYANAAASAFGVGNDRAVSFEKERAKADLSGESAKSGKKNAKAKTAE
jgi:CRISPR-associated protein Csb1